MDNQSASDAERNLERYFDQWRRGDANVEQEMIKAADLVIKERARRLKGRPKVAWDDIAQAAFRGWLSKIGANGTPGDKPIDHPVGFAYQCLKNARDDWCRKERSLHDAHSRASLRGGGQGLEASDPQRASDESLAELRAAVEKLPQAQRSAIQELYRRPPATALQGAAEALGMDRTAMRAMRDAAIAELRLALDQDPARHEVKRVIQDVERRGVRQSEIATAVGATPVRFSKFLKGKSLKLHVGPKGSLGGHLNGTQILRAIEVKRARGELRGFHEP